MWGCMGGRAGLGKNQGVKFILHRIFRYIYFNLRVVLLFGVYSAVCVLCILG